MTKNTKIKDSIKRSENRLKKLENLFNDTNLNLNNFFLTNANDNIVNISHEQENLLPDPNPPSLSQ